MLGRGTQTWNFNLNDFTPVNIQPERGAKVDKMNQAILRYLKANSRLTWQQIGREVHLTGQAVAARVREMEASGTITGFTVRIESPMRQFVTFFLDRPEFDAFEKFLRSEPLVESAHKVTGEGCYHLDLSASTTQEVDEFLSRSQRFGTYKVLSAMRRVK